MNQFYTVIPNDKEFTKRFNDMPFEQRSISADSEICSKIRDIDCQKRRLQDNYRRELKHFNDRIKYLQARLVSNERERKRNA